MSQSNLYGQILSGAHVELAVAAALSEWVDPYLYEIERDPVYGYQPGQIQRPLGVIAASQFDKWPEDQLPVMLVLSPGVNKPPTLRANGIYDAEWRVGIATVVSDVDQPSTRLLAQAYAAALRAGLVQHAMLKSDLFPDGFSYYVDWIGEDYTDTPFAATRTMQAGQVILAVGVESVVTKQAGPRTVPASPRLDPGNWPTVDETDTNVTVQPVSPVEALT